MDKGIRISEKHGLNPTMGVCFYCGKHTGEIALLGRLPDDKEAPKEMILNYSPCEECQKLFTQGVLIVEVTETDATTHQPEIREGYVPTGRHVVLKDGTLKDFKAGDKCLMLTTEFEQMFGSIINN